MYTLKEYRHDVLEHLAKSNGLDELKKQRLITGYWIETPEQWGDVLINKLGNSKHVDEALEWLTIEALDDASEALLMQMFIQHGVCERLFFDYFRHELILTKILS